MEIELYCDSHGDVKIKDVIIDLDGTNLDGGVDIHDAWGNLLCEIPGYCTDDFESNPDLLEEILNTL
jgi:hypothetical protein